MKIVVTGADGYIAGHLIQGLIEKKNQVIEVRRNAAKDLDTGQEFNVGPNAEFLTQVLDATKPDAVFHLAARSNNPDGNVMIPHFVNDNVAYATQVLQACIGRQLHFVQAGSWWQGATNKVGGTNSWYTASKQAFQLFLDHAREHHGLHATTLLLPDVYGPRDPRGRLIEQLVKAAKTGAAIELSNVEQTIDPLFVADVASGFLHATRINKTGTPHTMYLSGGGPVSIGQLVSKASTIWKKEIQAVWGARAVPRHCIPKCDMDTPKLIGWSARTPLEEGLRKCLENLEND